MCFCLCTYKEFPAEDGTDLHVCVLPGAGLPTHHHRLLTQCLQGAYWLDVFFKQLLLKIPVLVLCVKFLMPSSLPRLVYSGRSERMCTPALPAVTTWAKTTSWPKTWRFRCCLTSSIRATAKADEIEITFISRTRTYTHMRIHSVHPCIPSST